MYKKIEDFTTNNPEYKEFLDKLEEYFKDDKNVAVTAPMLGFEYNAFAIKNNDQINLFIDPQYEYTFDFDIATDEKRVLIERDFSKPDGTKKYLNIRANKIKVKYLDRNGAITDVELDGTYSICAQQMMDCLNGLDAEYFGLELPEAYDTAPENEQEEFRNYYTNVYLPGFIEYEKENRPKEVSDRLDALAFQEAVLKGKIQVGDPEGNPVTLGMTKLNHKSRRKLRQYQAREARKNR